MTYIIQNNEKRPAPRVINGVSIRPTPEVLAAHGLLPYDDSNSTPPEYDPATHKLSHGGYDAQGRDIWIVTDLTPEELEARAEAQRRQIESEIPVAVLKEQLRAGVDPDDITAEQIPDLVSLYPQYRVGVAVTATQILAIGRNTLVRVVQDHTTQADWDPLTTEALYQVLAPEEPGSDYPAWQPWGGNPANLYSIGARVSHGGKNWESTLDGNHWEPGSGTGWVEI